MNLKLPKHKLSLPICFWSCSCMKLRVYFLMKPQHQIKSNIALLHKVRKTLRIFDRFSIFYSFYKIINKSCWFNGYNWWFSLHLVYIYETTVSKQQKYSSAKIFQYEQKPVRRRCWMCQTSIWTQGTLTWHYLKQVPLLSKLDNNIKN